MATVVKTIGTASRDYSTITAWESDLGNTSIYSSGDDIVGECYNDTVFNERFSLLETSLSKTSVTLTAATSERHDGTLGTGVEVYWDASPGILAGDLAVTSHATIEWLILDSEYVATTLDAAYSIRTDVSNYRILNCILNKKRRNKSLGTPRGIYEYLNGALIANNIIQYWGRTSGVNYTPVSGYAIRKEHSNNNSQYFNNTIWDNYYGISVSGTANTDVRNNISQGTALSAYHGTITTEDYNIADDTTTTGANSIDSVSASSLFVSTVFGSEDLHILSGSDADGNGVDLSSVAPSAVYDIDGYDRSAASSWDIGADQYVSPSIALNSNIGLFLAGHPEESLPLFTKGANILGKEDPTTKMSLFVARQPEGFMPLNIGRDNFVSGQITLYTNAHEGFGGTFTDNNATLQIQGMANNAAPFTSTPHPTLYILGPPFEEYSTSVPLSITSEANPPVSGSITFFTPGGTASSEYPDSKNTSIPLYMRSYNAHNDGMDLNIETDFNLGNTIPLVIFSRNASGVAPLHIDGKAISSGYTTLYVRTPNTSTISLFNRGYKE